MKVIIINGPMGVGKTTVGKYIADHNPGTAFIDGDWCLDIHPFVGNRETKTMAVDNILHMIGNYKKCSECKLIVLVWLMDNGWVYDSIIDGIKKLELDIKSVTLTCGKNELTERWQNDKQCPWRTDEWLKVSTASLGYFSSLGNTLDTSGLTIESIARKITEE
ncbi:MAG: AAA family ATPase [Treponema sp.]|nr:AAA family ATPase [Treponema sp.]